MLDAIMTAFAWVKGLSQVMDIWAWFAAATPLGLFFKSVRRFAFTPPGSYIVMAALALAAGYGYGWYQYNQGYDAAKTEYETKIEIERQRLADEKRRAEQDAAERIKELENEATRREDILDQVTRGASGRTGRGVSSDSVRDLNRID